MFTSRHALALVLFSTLSLNHASAFEMPGKKTARAVVAAVALCIGGCAAHTPSPTEAAHIAANVNRGMPPDYNESGEWYLNTHSHVTHDYSEIIDGKRAYFRERSQGKYRTTFRWNASEESWNQVDFKPETNSKALTNALVFP
jgi:hypothetical protein